MLILQLLKKRIFIFHSFILLLLFRIIFLFMQNFIYKYLLYNSFIWRWIWRLIAFLTLLFNQRPLFFETLNWNLLLTFTIITSIIITYSTKATAYLAISLIMNTIFVFLVISPYKLTFYWFTILIYYYKFILSWILRLTTTIFCFWLRWYTI